MTIKATTRNNRSYRETSSSNNWERQVAKVRSIPIQTMCKELGIELTQGEDDSKGASWWGVCPVCPGHAPSLHVSPDSASGRGLYFCRDCSSEGDSLSLYMSARKKSFPETVRELANGF